MTKLTRATTIKSLAAVVPIFWLDSEGAAWCSFAAPSSPVKLPEGATIFDATETPGK